MSSALLTTLAYAMIIVFMALIMTKRLSVLTALILVPIVTGLLAGVGGGLGPMMLDGVRAIAPTGIMLAFAIIYFGLMIDVGLFEPVVRLVVRLVGGDPVKTVVGTAVLALTVSLDGDGSTTYLIVTAAMLPLYKRLGLSRLVLASVIMQAGGIMNILPWGGPTARAAAALKLDVRDLFVPMIPAMIAGAAWVIFVAWRLGLRERARLGVRPVPVDEVLPADETGRAEAAAARRPRHFWFNLALTLGLMGSLVAGLLLGMIQAATSINEQTLTFVPKLIVVAAMLAIFGGSILMLIADFTREVFERIPEVLGT